MAKARRKPSGKKSRLNHAALLTALVGLVLIIYAASFASSCSNDQFAATKAGHLSGLSCTVMLGDIIILLGIGILVLLIGLATLKYR